MKPRPSLPGQTPGRYPASDGLLQTTKSAQISLSTGTFFLALDESLVPVGAGGLPVAVGGLPVGLRRTTVAVGGYPVMASGAAVTPGHLPGHPGLRQHLPDHLAVFTVARPVRPGLSLAWRPWLPSGAAARERRRGGAFGGSLTAQLGIPK